MKPEAQRIAIAAILNWQKCPFDEVSFYVPMMGKVAVACDPLQDLNAMHEAEKTLRNQFTTQEETYWRNLSYVQPHPIYATASQRAEAFLRTICKWKDDDK